MSATAGGATVGTPAQADDGQPPPGTTADSTEPSAAARSPAASPATDPQSGGESPQAPGGEGDAPSQSEDQSPPAAGSGGEPSECSPVPAEVSPQTADPGSSVEFPQGATSPDGPLGLRDLQHIDHVRFRDVCRLELQPDEAADVIGQLGGSDERITTPEDFKRESMQWEAQKSELRQKYPGLSDEQIAEEGARRSNNVVARRLIWRAFGDPDDKKRYRLLEALHTLAEAAEMALEGPPAPSGLKLGGQAGRLGAGRMLQGAKNSNALDEEGNEAELITGSHSTNSGTSHSAGEGEQAPGTKQGDPGSSLSPKGAGASNGDPEDVSPGLGGFNKAGKNQATARRVTLRQGVVKKSPKINQRDQTAS